MRNISAFWPPVSYTHLVDTVTVLAGGETYTFKSSGDVQNIEATVNGNEMEPENYQTMYEFLISASATEIKMCIRDSRRPGPETDHRHQKPD